MNNAILYIVFSLLPFSLYSMELQKIKKDCTPQAILPFKKRKYDDTIGEIDCTFKRVTAVRSPGINRVNEKGKTQLEWAAGNGSVAEVAELISGGADVNHCNNKRETPFMWAIRKGHSDVVAYMCKNADIDLSIRDIQDKTPFHYAAITGNAEIIKSVKELYTQMGRGSFYTFDAYQNTPLIDAVKAQRFNVIDLLVDDLAPWSDADTRARWINMRNNSGDTVGHLLLKMADKNQISVDTLHQLLLKLYCFGLRDAKNHNGQTMEHIARSLKAPYNQVHTFIARQNGLYK